MTTYRVVALYDTYPYRIENPPVPWLSTAQLSLAVAQRYAKEAWIEQTVVTWERMEATPTSVAA